MHRREVIASVAGLVIGLFIGMILIGISDDLRESLFGTAGTKEEIKHEYYLVSLDDTQKWLSENYPDESEKFETTVEVLSKISASWKTEDEYESAKAEFDVILQYAYGTLIDDKDIENLKEDPEADISTCLGYDNDPYEQAVYLYMTLPSKTTEELEIPKEWQKLKESQDNKVLWQLLECYPKIDKE